jgi:hypothetical protein
MQRSYSELQHKDDITALAPFQYWSIRPEYERSGTGC